MTQWRALTGAAADLLLGSACVGCAAPGPLLCPLCSRRLVQHLPARTRPSPLPAGLPPVYAVAAYDDAARAALVAHKEHNRLSLAGALGRALSWSVLGLLADLRAPRLTSVTLVPAPSSRRTVRDRGHDPLLRMTRQAVRHLRHGGVAVEVRPCLRVARAVADQAGLSSQARAANLAGAFAVRRSVPAGPVIVVDDVITTGSTLVEASRALADAGVAVWGAAVVAATARRLPVGRDLLPRPRDRWERC